MTIDEISRKIGTDELGTRLENVEKINEELLKTLPSVEFNAELNCGFDEIENEILGGKPVIAWIKMPHQHSVVVTGVDKERLLIYCNDPQIGEREVKMGDFVSAWGENDNVLIKVKIGEKIQRIIPEYSKNNNKEDEN